LTLAADPTQAYIAGNQSGSPGYESGKPTWLASLHYTNDQFTILRQGVTLLTLENTGNLTIPAWFKSTRTAIGAGTNDMDYYGNDAATVGYDSAKYLMLYRQNFAAGVHYWFTSATPGGGYVEKMRVAQNGDLAIAGSNATKATGTTWINPSDIRLKRDITPYAHGLADILQLEPISYTLKATEQQTCGLDAEKVRAVFPECVGTTRMKLQPEDEEETEVLTLDIHPILIALINAVRELNEKVS
jgi:hypothetical protein